MKKILVILGVALFLISLAFAGSLTGSAVNELKDDSQNQIGADANSEDTNDLSDDVNDSDDEDELSDSEDDDEDSDVQIKEKIRERNQEEFKEMRKIKNMLRIHNNLSDCPNNCTCTGSATKCQTQNGREMIIEAGESGITIFKIQNKEMRTKIELYKDGDKVYGVFKNNQTREIKILPDEVQEKIRERLKLKNCSCETELDDDGNYITQTKRKAKLLGLIPVKKQVRIEVNSETGEITKTKTSWWGFLARDSDEEVESE